VSTGNLFMCIAYLYWPGFVTLKNCVTDSSYWIYGNRTGII